MSGLAGGIARRVRRLSAMDAPEVGHRLREVATREWEGLLVALRGARTGEARGLRGDLPDDFLPPDLTAGASSRSARLRTFLERAAGRFFVPVDAAARRRSVDWVESRFPEWIARAAAEAERVCAHRVELLGDGEAALGPEIDWHRDPRTGAVWPRRFWGRYDLVGGPETADPKRVHELNRQQHVARLAKASLLCGEPRYAAEAVGQLLSWVRQNPPGVGVNWHSSLEIALRATAWQWALFFLLPSPALDDAALETILGSWCAQLDHVRRFPSTYSSPNTHLLGEAAALVLAGLVFVDGAWGRRCLRDGRRLLLGAVERQVSGEGAHCELSLYYHCYALEFCLHPFLLARRSAAGSAAPLVKAPGAPLATAPEAPLATALAAPLERMFDFLAQLTQPDGTLPLLGDDDGGRALGLAATDYREPGDLLGAGAVLFGSAACAARAGEFREETFWLLGADAMQAHRAQHAFRPDALRASFPTAGYFVQRSGWSARDSQLTFDCGGLGAPSGGHGHADALSITLAAAGRPMLVDPGTYVYNREPAWRAYFRSTAAHNTATVDGRAQSEPAGTFSWQSRAECRLLDDLRFESVDYLAAEHDGYARGARGITHRRRVLYARPEYWLIADDFRGRGEHTFEVFYHLAPGVSWSACDGGSAARFDLRLEDQDARPAAGAGAGGAGDQSGLLLSFHASTAFEVECNRARDGHPAGWVSRRYGAREPGTVVSVRLRAAAPASVVAVLAPYELAGDVAAVGEARARGIAIAQRPTDGGGLALEIQERRRRDVLLLAPAAGESEAFGCRGAGELLWARFDGDRLARFLAVRATRFSAGGPELLHGAAPFTGYSADSPSHAGSRVPSGPRSAGALRTEEDRRVRHRWHR